MHRCYWIKNFFYSQTMVGFGCFWGFLTFPSLASGFQIYLCPHKLFVSFTTKIEPRHQNQKAYPMHHAPNYCVVEIQLEYWKPHVADFPLSSLLYIWQFELYAANQKLLLLYTGHWAKVLYFSYDVLDYRTLCLL